MGRARSRKPDGPGEGGSAMPDPGGISPAPAPAQASLGDGVGAPFSQRNRVRGGTRLFARPTDGPRLSLPPPLCVLSLGILAGPGPPPKMGLCYPVSQRGLPDLTACPPATGWKLWAGLGEGGERKREREREREVPEASPGTLESPNRGNGSTVWVQNSHYSNLYSHTPSGLIRVHR